MTLEEFKNIINLRSIEKCCATCKYGDQDYVGDWRCYLPELVEVTDKDKNYEIQNFGQGWFMDIRPKFLCDKWEAVKQ